jgi:glucan-binding YG repeat protein
MLKRSTKVVSALVAMASIVSTVSATPVYASTSTKMTEKDGVVNNAFAYKDGKVVFDGGMPTKSTDDLDDLDEYIHFYNGSSMKQLDDEDVESGNTLELYGEKYLEVSGGDYYIDLNSGSITDDTLREDDLSDASSNFRKKLRKDKPDRYTEDLQSTDITFKAISQNKYLAPYFEGEADSEKASDFKYNGGASSYHIYTDTKGNYVDADYNLGKVVVKSTTDSAVSISSTSLTTTKSNKNDLQAVIKHVETIGADSSNIYRLADLSVYYVGGDYSSNPLNITSSLSFGNKGVVPDSANGKIRVLQQISKSASSETEDDALVPKEVKTYFLTDDNGTAVGLYDNVSINDGKIVSYEVSSSEVKAMVLTPKQSAGYTYLESDSDDIEISKDKFATDTDKDGNLWVLTKGKVYKFDDSFEEKYRVGTTCNKLSAYDSSNIVAFEEDGESYFSLGGKSTTTDKEEGEDKVEDTTNQDTVTKPTQTGLVTNVDGSKSFINSDGTKATGWVKNGSDWYLFDSQGVSKTGWQQNKGTWYHLSQTGVMDTDWYYESSRDTWYYLNSDGSMFNSGWLKNPHDNMWYYIQADGAMLTGWQQIQGVWYNFNTVSNGYRGCMNTGWVLDSSTGKWYYLNSSGALLSNQVVDGWQLQEDGSAIKLA